MVGSPVGVYYFSDDSESDSDHVEGKDAEHTDRVRNSTLQTQQPGLGHSSLIRLNRRGRLCKHYDYLVPWVLKRPSYSGETSEKESWLIEMQLMSTSSFFDLSRAVYRNLRKREQPPSILLPGAAREHIPSDADEVALADMTASELHGLVLALTQEHVRRLSSPRKKYVERLHCDDVDTIDGLNCLDRWSESICWLRKYRAASLTYHPLTRLRARFWKDIEALVKLFDMHHHREHLIGAYGPFAEALWVEYEGHWRNTLRILALSPLPIDINRLQTPLNACAISYLLPFSVALAQMAQSETNKLAVAAGLRRGLPLRPVRLPPVRLDQQEYHTRTEAGESDTEQADRLLEDLNQMPEVERSRVD
jgi:hypothetical protein